MTDSVSPVSFADNDLTEIEIQNAEFPILLGKEAVGISFQVRPEDAPTRFYERAHGDDAGEHGVQAGNGELFETYKNIALMSTSITALGLKVVDVYYKKKVMSPKNKRDAARDARQESPEPHRLRSVVYFWLAQEDDERNFQDPEFYEYAVTEFERLASNVYVTAESYTNPNGPACIALKGVAQCHARTVLTLVEGDLEIVSLAPNSTEDRPNCSLVGPSLLGSFRA